MGYRILVTRLRDLSEAERRLAVLPGPARPSQQLMPGAAARPPRPAEDPFLGAAGARREAQCKPGSSCRPGQRGGGGGKG